MIVYYLGCPVTFTVLFEQGDYNGRGCDIGEWGVEVEVHLYIEIAPGYIHKCAVNTTSVYAIFAISMLKLEECEFISLASHDVSHSVDFLLYIASHQLG